MTTSRSGGSVPLPSGTASGVRGPFTYPASSYVDVHGERASEVKARPYRFSADLRWDAAHRRWRVLDYGS